MKTKTSLILIAVLLTTVISPLYVEAQTSKYTITGAGATFPFPLIDLWRVKYGEIHPNISLNYQSIGSGGGVKQHIEKTVNFGATDAPLTKNELQLVPDTLHIPEAIGGVTVAYNIPEVPNSGLKLTGTQVADIFLGKIKRWNDPGIKANNPTLNLPDKEIVTAHRSDGSGTTHVFTEYLAMISPEWDEKVGFGKSVPWPTGLGAVGNEGVAGVVRSTPYSVGYVELAYVVQSNMQYAFIQNADKTAFVEPTLQTMSAAAAGAAPKLPQAHESWYGVTINNAPGKDSYPITSFTYLLLHEKLETSVKDKAQAKEVINLIKWMITDGQKYSPELLYVPLPPEVTEIGLEGLSRVTYNGEKLYDDSTTPDSGIMPSESVTLQVQEGQEGGGCLIATATYGSELAPQVQFLREIRDNTVLGTQSGTSFMTAFNTFYYSFSPTVADWERQNPAFNAAVKFAITPLIATLSILQYVDIDSEHQMLGYGISIILLNIGMYFVAPAALIIKLRQKFFN